MRISWMFLVLLGLTGCAGAEYGAELRKRPIPVNLEPTENRRLQLPGDGAFMITLKEATEKAELNGTADADGQASGDGTGSARAEVTEGGTAAASFQVGHSLKNHSQRHMQLQVEARMKLSFEVADGSADPLPLAGAYATLYARNNQNRTLGKYALLAHKSDQGDASGTDTETVAFKLLLGPGETVNLYVAGHVQINAEDGQTGSGSVKLEGLEMDIQVAPAPAIGAADNAG